jgi:hypothetical protein
MIESIRTKIWELLKDKEVSLALIFDKEGKIHWHKGRKIKGDNVFDGEGFCKSYIVEALEQNVSIETENTISSSVERHLTESAILLQIKSLIILPVDANIFIYIDSGTKDYFDEIERNRFKVIAKLIT